MERTRNHESARVNDEPPVFSFGEFLRQLLRQLEERRISPCVLRNYAGFPESNIGNDVDFMIHAHQLPAAIRAVQSISGVRIVGYNEQFHVAMMFLDGVSAVPGRHAFQVDFIRSFTWKGLPYLTTEEIIASAGSRNQGEITFLAPSPVHEAVISLLSNLVISGFVKERYFTDARKVLRDSTAEAIAILRPAFGQRAAAQVVESLVEGNRDKVLACIGPLRSALAVRSFLRKPLPSLFAVARHCAIVLGVRHCARTLETIRIVSSDASLRMQAADALIPALRYLAPEVEHENDRKRDELPQECFSTAGLLRWLCGQWRRQFSGRKNLTLRISSTPLLNLFVSPESCGYRGPRWIASLAMRLLPPADLWILLEPHTKSDPSLVKYQAWVRSQKRSIELNAPMPGEEIISRMREAIVRVLAQRTAERLGPIKNSVSIQQRESGNCER